VNSRPAPEVYINGASIVAGCRFEQMANEMLAETTIAGQEGVIEYVANSAALQQFEQTSLAYLVLRQHEGALDVGDVCSEVEHLLEQRFQASGAGDCSWCITSLGEELLREQMFQARTSREIRFHCWVDS